MNTSSKMLQHRLEKRKDEITGRTVTQLTSLPGNHHHLYFTSSSFTADNRHILYISDTGTGSPNLFKLALDDGTAVQLTENRDGYMKSYVYYDGNPYRGLAKASPSFAPAADKLLYIQGSEVRLLNVNSLEERVVYVLPERVMTGFTHLFSDGRYACIPYIDADAFEVGEGNPFGLIRDNVKKEQLSSHIVVVDTTTGEILYSFSHQGWVTHVQFHPHDPNIVLFNHEGGMVEQRIWLYDHGAITRVRDQSDGGPSLWICHEMWAGVGKAVIYHGTRGVPNDPAMKDSSREQGQIVSFVGYMDTRDGQCAELSFSPEMTAYGHFTASTDESLLVTDGIIDAYSIHLCRMDWQRLGLDMTLLCRHNSSFTVQDVHAHPIFSHDDRYVLFTSDAHNERTKGNLYLVDLNDM
ncbi:oligogalacturonate lyase family protein [Paenibacillus sp. UNC451MF]|uniref:oligogalacturonate lyase family protein n=1 Tax=Paenibacillus sp. UNC451MF TaxID=1449063 RepID=UPI00048C1E1E|nr:oligogalacturonate lyase family protein [Paenibacillus sp. UNC451MF]